MSTHRPGPQKPRKHGVPILVRGATGEEWRRADPTVLAPRAPIVFPSPSRREGTRWALTLRRVVAVMAVLIVALLVFRASAQSFRAEGVSMLPNLESGQYLVINKLAYSEIDFGLLNWAPFYTSASHRWSTPGYGDVIVFDSPTGEGRFVKRIIGLPGDVISVDPEARMVVRNGEVLDEPYTLSVTDCFLDCGPWVVPEGEYFVMGDNRRNSIDSRDGWTVPLEAISGKVVWSR
jgi:signal peptidase I